MVKRIWPFMLLVSLLAAFTGVAVAALLGIASVHAPPHVLRVSLPAADRELPLPKVGGEADWPLVVIDAGHGGHDPGASSQGYVEKDVVLGLAKALQAELLREGGVRVALTRTDDRYLVHAERFGIARRLGADLFLSIHADSAGEAADVTGASVYTLSDKASSEAAARYAERENSSDVLNGVDLGGQSDAVSTILVELSQRRVQDKSADFARLVVREGQGTLNFHPQPLRSAALKVLRAPDVPSALFESGFITNETDAQRLTSPDGRRAFAEAMARAIRIYLAKQAPG